MDDALGMRGLQRVGYLDRQVKQYVDFQWLLSDTLFQRPAFQQLHGNEVPAIGLANFINCANIRVIQRRSRARLALKTSKRGATFSNSPGKNLRAKCRLESRSSAS